MKKIFIIIQLFFLITSGFCAKEKVLLKSNKNVLEKDFNQFLVEQSKIRKNNYLYNPYENIISGAAAFLIGNVGYFTTNSTPLSVAYSGIQTIGIINVGRGAYEYYRPDFEQNLYQISLKYQKNNDDPQAISREVVRLFAQEARAKRLALLYTSSLLSTQYFANAMIGNQAQSLKSIYYFLGSVNLMVVGFSLFHKNIYEEYYYSNSKINKEESVVNWNVLPVVEPSKGQGIAAVMSWEF